MRGVRGTRPPAASGRHLLVDLHEAVAGLDDESVVREALLAAVAACGATLLALELRRFTPNGGVTGVALLAESHVTIHTWPEAGYAAVDAFTCGEADPRAVIPVFRDAFGARRVEVREHRRGAEAPRGRRESAA